MNQSARPWNRIACLTDGFQRPGLAVILSLCLVHSVTLVQVAHGVQKAQGQDWSQPLGNGRDSKTEFRLPASWSPDQMRAAWEIPAGEGFAGPIAIGGVVYLWDRVDDQLRLQAVELKTGKVKWTTRSPAVYAGGFDPDKGPRATLCYHDGKLFAWSAGGILLCVSSGDGEILWRRNLAESMPGGEGYFGYGAGPMVVDQTLVLNIGGRDAAVIGIDIQDGSQQWIAGDDQASYAIPIVAKIGERSVVVMVTRLNAWVIDPADGALLGQTDFGKKGATVNGASPVLMNDQQVFFNAAYGVGAKVVQLPQSMAADAQSVPQTSPLPLPVLWSSPSSFASQYTTPVFSEGYLYGTTGREDFDDAQLRCVRASDGKVMWSEKKWTLAHPILAGDTLLLWTLDCRLVAAKASPEKYVALGERLLVPGVARPLPAVADGYFVFRTIAAGRPAEAKWYAFQLSPQN